MRFKYFWLCFALVDAGLCSWAITSDGTFLIWVLVIILGLLISGWEKVSYNYTYMIYYSFKDLDGVNNWCCAVTSSKRLRTKKLLSAFIRLYSPKYDELTVKNISSKKERIVK